MTRSEPRRRFRPCRTTCAIAASIALAACFIEGIEAQSPDQTFVSGKDVVLYPPDHGISAFKFLPGGSPLPFDRSLVLSAAPGETRTYLVQSGEYSSVSRGDAPIVAYVVDKRRPRAPSAEPGTGLYYDAIAPALKAGGGTAIFWALVGPDGTASAFAALGDDARPRLIPPAKGTVTYTLLSYAANSSGARSYPARFVYRLAEPGLSAAAPRPDSASLTANPSLPKPSIKIFRGYAELSISLPQGASLLADFSADSAPQIIDDFEKVEAVDGVATLRVPCPYAWAGDVSLYYGMLNAGMASYCPQPLVLHLSCPADDRAPPADPPMPVLAADNSGRGGFIAFPSYDGDIYVSLGTAKPSLYASPIALPRDATSLRVSWYGEDSGGQRTATRSQYFVLPETVPDIELAGAAEGAAIGGDVLIRPAVKTVSASAAAASQSVRYELKVDGSFPPEPGPSSPILGDGLTITCPPGEERSIVLRYRQISGDAESEGRILRFTLDRKPPEAPRFRDATPSYFDSVASLELMPGTGGKDVFASVSADGAPASFFPVDAPLVFAGSEAGPVKYLIRAYDIDAAGNRSQEMKPITLVVDRSSEYAAEDGSDKGDGTPDRPFKSLDAAIAAAIRGGKRSINLRGSLEMRASAQFSKEMSLNGGFGKSWVKDSSARAIVRVSVAGQSAFVQRGASLALNRVELYDESAGVSPLIELAGTSLSVDNSSLVAGSDGDFILISASQSKISLTDSRLKAIKAMSFTAFSSDRSDISLSRCSISAARDVRIFGAFDMDGGSLVMGQSLLECSSDLGLNLFSLRLASLLVDRSLITVDGGSGFLRLGSFKSVSGEMKNSKVILAWKGPGTLFEIADGGPSFRHDTVTASSTKGLLRFFDLKGPPPQIWNCILDSAGTGSELLRSDSIPGAGLLVADCVWGFDRLISGALDTSDLASLNAFNAPSALYSSKPVVSEPPESSFAAPLKSQAPLRRNSACVGAALSLGSGYEVDFSGHPRPGSGKDGPDIGADELSD